MIERKEYLQRLYDWKDEQVIKVVTGIRRCGKSTLLKQYQEKLMQSGILPEQIISINFEDLEISGKAYAEWYFTGTGTSFHQF